MLKATFTHDTDPGSGYLIDLEAPDGKKLVLCIRHRRPDYLELEVLENGYLTSDRPTRRPLVAREIYTLRDLLFYKGPGEGPPD